MLAEQLTSRARSGLSQIVDREYWPSNEFQLPAR